MSKATSVWEGRTTATKRARGGVRARATRWMATETNRARVTAARGMAMATRVAGNKKGNGDKGGDGMAGIGLTAGILPGTLPT
jgi:hypothetical protein